MVELQSKLNSQAHKVFDATVKALIRKDLAPKYQGRFLEDYESRNSWNPKFFCLLCQKEKFPFLSEKIRFLLPGETVAASPEAATLQRTTNPWPILTILHHRARQVLEGTRG